MKLVQEYLKNKKYIVFLDFEGTQFSHEIIAVGAVKCLIKDDSTIEEISSYRRIVKPLGTIGKIVESMTSLNENIIRNEGITLEEMFSEFEKFIDTNFYECLFVAFGSNDLKMIIDSISYSKPENAHIGYQITKNMLDFLNIITQFIKDNNGNNYSLTNYLKLFNKEPYGQSHDPLNDSYDLMTLFIEFNSQKDVVLNEYLKVLKKSNKMPLPVKKIVDKLINGKDVKSNDLINECKEYLK